MFTALLLEIMYTHIDISLYGKLDNVNLYTNIRVYIYIYIYIYIYGTHECCFYSHLLKR